MGGYGCLSSTGCYCTLTERGSISTVIAWILAWWTQSNVVARLGGQQVERDRVVSAPDVTAWIETASATMGSRQSASTPSWRPWRPLSIRVVVGCGHRNGVGQPGSLWPRSWDVPCLGLGSPLGPSSLATSPQYSCGSVLRRCWERMPMPSPAHPRRHGGASPASPLNHRQPRRPTLLRC